jgi:hypothetical protein
MYRIMHFKRIDGTQIPRYQKTKWVRGFTHVFGQFLVTLGQRPGLANRAGWSLGNTVA